MLFRSVPNPSSGVQLEKFDGSNFKIWQKKMFFYLTTLKLDKYLKEDKPVVPPENTDVRVLASAENWVHGDFLCMGHIQNRLVDPLYNVYCNANSAKELWNSLQTKYQTDDAGTKKVAIAKFLEFTMVDSKPVMEQVEAFQLILHDILAEGMALPETFQIGRASCRERVCQYV